MPQITATVGGSGTISASVSESAIAASIIAQQIGTSVVGGIGPAGEMEIGLAKDASLNGLDDGDVLRYSQGKWRNHPEDNLTDGGNF